MFSFHSIKAKILFFSGLCMIASLIAVIAYATSMSRGMALENAIHTASKEAYIEALGIKGRIDTGLDLARGLAQTLQGYTSSPEGHPLRGQVVSMQRELLVRNDELMGVRSAWEPDAFDGMDATADAPGTQPGGRFAPYWTRSGGVHLAPIKGDLERARWYTVTRRRAAETIVNPVRATVNGQTTTIVTIAAPISVNGRTIGVAGVDVTANFLQELANSIAIFGQKADVTFVTHTGLVSGRTGQTGVIGRNFADVEERGSAILKQTHAGGTVHFFRDGKLHIYVPVEMGKTGSYWTVGVAIDEASVYAEANAMALKTTLIGGGCLALALVVLWLLAGRLARPLHDTATAVNRIAEGDLSTRLDAATDCEVGQMQSAVNAMATKMQQNIADIERQMNVAREKSAQAEKAMLEAEEARKKAESAKSEGMMQAASQLEQVVERISTAMEEISAQSEEVRKGTDVQKSRIQATATAMEEMNATVLEVAQNAGFAADQGKDAREQARKGQSVVTSAIDAMATSKRQTEALRVAMNDLDQQARSIGSIMNVIEDIADQTNLLALNAAVEAARAGDAGRGFAVVADEVRKLAEKTMNATKEVGATISSIQKVADSNVASMDNAEKDINTAVTFANESGEVLGTIVDGAERSAEQIQSIATAAEQQSSASEEINRSIEEVHQIAQDTAQSIEETVIALREMAQQSSQLASLIQDLKNDSAQG
ncbi:methyl-accepting chemotaxis protein [Desulfobaculum sp.]